MPHLFQFTIAFPQGREQLADHLLAHERIIRQRREGSR
jgi:hypothetical protein